MSYDQVLEVQIMRSKKSRKTNANSGAVTCSKKTDDPPAIKIKFNINKDNLLCFIGQSNNYKKIHRKTSKSMKKSKAIQQKTNLGALIIKQTASLPKVEEKLDDATELVRSLSNQILSQIEDKGMQCAWNDIEDEKTLDLQQENEQENSQIWSIFSYEDSYEKSYASTMDYYYLQTSYGGDQQIKYNYQYNGFQIRLSQIGCDPRTTIMIRNIPNKYSIKQLAEEIDQELSNTYDFLYLPCDLKNQCNVGYGFINFINTEYLRMFYLNFNNYRWYKFRSQKICNLTYARLQGLNSLIQHFENSKVLNQKDKKYRPIIRQSARIDHLIKSQQQQ